MPIDVPVEIAAARNRVAALAEERRRLVASSSRERVRFSDVGRFDANIAEVLEGVRDRIDACDASPEVPLVLLPVRLETKLAPGTSTLRVRITPDELHLDALVRAITPDEQAAGRAYWTTLWTDAAAPAAWNDLAAAVGARRAGWVAQATTPSNLAGRTASGSLPAFPDTPEEVTRGTVARCLPDRFIVRVFPRGSAPITVRGATLPRDIPISPVALSSLDDFVAAGNGLSVPAGSEWTVDFAKAKQAGLGIEVPLPAGTQVLDRIVVVGVRGSVSELENAADFADLLLSHRYSDGFGLLAQSTPTNNAEAERSPYKVSATPAAPPIVSGVPTADLARLASMIGLEASAVERLLDPADSRPTLETTQRAANTALWFATWEPVLQRFDVELPGVTPAGIESARRLHRDHVRGAGPAPVIRVGAQPYGILPISNLDEWAPRSGDTTAALVPLIRRTLGRWGQRATSVPRVRPGDSITDEAFVELLGTSPIGIGLRARPAVDGTNVGPFAAATGAPGPLVEADMLIKRAVLSQYSVDAARILAPVSLHESTRTINLPLVSERDAEVIAAILADQEPKMDSVLQALLAVAWDNVKRQRFRVAPEQFVSPLLALLELSPDVARLVRDATERPDAADIGTTDASSVAARSARFFAAAEKVRTVQHFDRQPIEQLSIAAVEPVPEAQTSLAQVALDLGDTVQAKWIGSQAISGLLDWFGVRAEVRTAMRELGAAPIAERRLAVAQALDIASHRVDAWATGLASSRRETLAVSNPTGMTLGAFGYVEDVRLSRLRREPDGWIHAPSTAHAVTAGVLASAHRSNIGAQAGQHPFAIDLSSRRGAELRRVLEGVAAGQSIGALLGYQIERAIAGTSAARFQLSLRQLAPMATDELGNDLAELDGDAARAQARAAVADVVDGLALLRLFPAASLHVPSPPLRARLAARPHNVFVEQWPAMADAEWNAIVAAIEAAAATLDAVADALLSESVLQYVSGNAARASTAMNAMSSGAGVDPALDVLDVRQPTKRLSHGVFAVIPADAAGWSTTRPRAVAEPRLEAWAARRLGDPASIVVADVAGTPHTLAGTGLAALDVVFAADTATLERDIRAAVPALGDAPLAAERGPAWPAGTRSILQVAVLARTLRTLIARGTSISPTSLVRPGAAPQRRTDTDDLLARADQLVAAFQTALDAGADVIRGLDPTTLAVAPADAPAIAAAVAPLGAFGVPLVPDGDPKAVGNVAWAWGAWHAASARLDRARATLAALRAPRVAPAAPPGPEEILDACQRVADFLLGDGFSMLPLLVQIEAGAGGRDAFAQAVRQPVFAQPPLAKINAFLRDHATVLDGVGLFSEAQLLGGALGRPVRLSVVQLTERDGATPAPGTDRWLAGPLPDDMPWPDSTVAHLIVELPGDDADIEGPLAGLAVDAWVEAVPFQPDRRALAPEAPENPLRNARATTGLAVHANQASARAPQVVLSAVSPDNKRWTTDSVVQTVIEAIDLAKARMVTLERVPGDAAVLPAIYVKSPWLQGRRGFSFTDLAQIAWDPARVPFLTEVK
jgi:hypothetical protein